MHAAALGSHYVFTISKTPADMMDELQILGSLPLEAIVRDGATNGILQERACVRVYEEPSDLQPTNSLRNEGYLHVDEAPGRKSFLINREGYEQLVQQGYLGTRNGRYSADFFVR